VCCTPEYSRPQLSFVCTKAGKCCDPEGCECGVYKKIEFGESCDSLALKGNPPLR